MSVLEKSAQIIDVLGHADGPVRLGAVADAVAVPKATAHRLLGELSRLGIVHSQGDGGYTLGYRLVQWGALADVRFELRAIAEPSMHELSGAVAESVHLHVPEGTSRVCVAGVPGPHTLRPVITVGTTRRLGIGAAGKLLLAFADDPGPTYTIDQFSALALATTRSRHDDLPVKRSAFRRWLLAARCCFVVVDDAGAGGGGAMSAPSRFSSSH